MARAHQELIRQIRATAKKVSKTKEYQWGHMGACNCGFLAQEITKLSKAEIHRRAMQRHGDWNEQIDDYCPTSGLLMDDLISELINAGLDRDDMKNLEKLSDPYVLKHISSHAKPLRHNYKADVVLYLRIWADLMESELVYRKEVSTLTKQEV